MNAFMVKGDIVLYEFTYNISQKVSWRSNVVNFLASFFKFLFPVRLFEYLKNKS